MAQDKGVMVSFRVDRHLADVLARIPDKSSFIRDIILRSFYETCPVCRGRGVWPQELARWAARQLKADRSAPCRCCLYSFPKSTRRGGARKAARRPFVCPHCEQHEHKH